MEDLLFWQRWNECKYLFEGMEKALNKAKENNPTKCYCQQEEKLRIMENLQGYLGQLHERYTTLKEINLEHGERYGKLKELYLKQAKELQALTNENKQLKENIK